MVVVVAPHVVSQALHHMWCCGCHGHHTVWCCRHRTASGIAVTVVVPYGVVVMVAVIMPHGTVVIGLQKRKLAEKEKRKKGKHTRG